LAGRARRGYPLSALPPYPLPRRGAAGSRGTISGRSSTSWPRMISERRCSGALLQSRADFHDLYDALLRQLSRAALHPRLQAHAPHHPAAHHLAPSSTAFRGGWPASAFGIFPRNRPDKTFSIPHVAAMYMAAQIAREEDRGTLGSDCSRFRPRAAGADPERQAENSAGSRRALARWPTAEPAAYVETWRRADRTAWPTGSDPRRGREGPETARSRRCRAPRRPSPI
jgi:hypothetical protein